MKKAFNYWIKNFSYCFLDSIVILFSRLQKISNNKKVLLIRLDAIGDYILWRNAGYELIEDYQSRGRNVVLLANSLWSDFAQKDIEPHTLWALDTKKFTRNPLYRMKFAWKIATEGFDIAINPVYSRSFAISDAAIRLSRAKVRVGSLGDASENKPVLYYISNHWYTELIPAIEKPLMELIRNAEFMHGMGYRKFSATPPLLHSRAIEYPSNLPTQEYIVIFPGASWSGRQWPTERFAQIATKIYIQTGVMTVICGGPADIHLATTICKTATIPIMDLTGKTSLSQLIGAIKNAAAVVSNETSAVHIAAAVGTPSVCILGGGHFGRFLPYQITTERPENVLPKSIYEPMSCFNCNWNCHYLSRQEAIARPTPCIDLITVEKIYNQLLDCLSSTKFSLSSPVESSKKIIYQVKHHTDTSFFSPNNSIKLR